MNYYKNIMRYKRKLKKVLKKEFVSENVYNGKHLKANKIF